MNRQRYCRVFSIFWILIVLFCSMSFAAQPVTSRVSVDSSNHEGNGVSKSFFSLSGDGRYVAFYSSANNLVAGDNNNKGDVFVRDRQTGETTMISLGFTPDFNVGPGNGDSGYPSLCSDGRYVAFLSYANNLVSGDSNGKGDIFVRDRQAGTTTMISIGVAPDFTPLPSNGDSAYPSISADGRYVAFRSVASNLVPGDTNGKSDVFVRDRQTGQTARVSVDSLGNAGNKASYSPSISGDGRYVAFWSDATNLVSGDANGVADAFVRDRQTGQTTRISVDSLGHAGNQASYYPSISSDGRYVAFSSYADNLVSGDDNNKSDVFVHDCQTGQTFRVSVDSNGNGGNGGIDGSGYPSISGDGRYVTFLSDATNLVTGDSNGMIDVFVHDCKIGRTLRASVNSNGDGGNGDSGLPSISSDGRYVAFWSDATNLVAGDANGFQDVFVRGPLNDFSWEMFLPAIIGK